MAPRQVRFKSNPVISLPNIGIAVINIAAAMNNL